MGKQLLLASYYDLNAWGKRIVIGYDLEDHWRTFGGISLEATVRLENVTIGKSITFTRAEWGFLSSNLENIISWLSVEGSNEIESNRLDFESLSIQHVISYGKQSVKISRQGITSITMQRATIECVRR